MYSSLPCGSHPTKVKASLATNSVCAGLDLANKAVFARSNPAHTEFVARMT